MSPRLLVLSCVMFIVATNSSVIAGLLPHIAHDLHTDQATVSYSVTVYALIVAVAAPLTSAYLARVPRGLLMAAGCILFALGTAVAGLSQSAAVFMAGRAVAAVGGAALVPVAMAVGSSLVPPAHRGTAISTISVGFTVAGAFGAPLGTVVGSAATWRVPLLGLAGLGLVIGAVLVVVLRASVLNRITYDETALTDGRVSEAPEHGARPHSVGGTPAPRATVHGAGPHSVGGTPAPRASVAAHAAAEDPSCAAAPGLVPGHPLRDRRILLTVLSTFCLMIGFNSVIIFSARLFEGATGGDGSRLAALLMAFGIAGIVGNSLAGPMTDRYGNKGMGTVFLAVFAILLVATTVAIDHFAAAAVAMALAGAVMSMATVPIQHRLLALGEGRATQTLAWNSTSVYLGLAMAPLLANAVLGIGGVHAPPIAAGAVTLVALVLFALGQARGRSSGEFTTRRGRLARVVIYRQ